MTKNKEIQEQRIRQYFIEATREILKGEGLRAVNVRSVSERAGYSYATLYNYFKDLNELIFICVQDFMSDCEIMIDEQTSDMQPGLHRLKKRMKAFIQYFTQYPDIFELIYLERMNDPGSRQGTARMIYAFTDSIIDEDIKTLRECQFLDVSRAENIKLSLKNSITGLLLFYNNRLQPTDYKDFLKIADLQIDICLTI